MRVHHDNIIVKPLEQKELLDNGISIDTTIASRMQIVTGEVIKVSKDVPEIKQGDIVWYPLYGAKEITYKGNRMFVINHNDIIISEKGAK